MKSKLIKRYIKHFILFLFLLLNISISFTPKGLILDVNKSFAQEGSWSTGEQWLDDLLGSYNYTPGTYVNDGSGSFFLCNTCAFHVNVTEVTVYGTDMSQFGIYTPDFSETGSINHYEPAYNQWNLWDYPTENWLAQNLVSKLLIVEPTVQQHNTLWCMYACAEYLSSFFGCIRSTQIDFAADYLGTTSGIPANTGANFGTFVNKYYSGGHLPTNPPTHQEIKYYIDSGEPILVEIDEGAGAHAVVIAGYDNGKYQIMDPGPGTIRKMTHSDLLSKATTSNGLYTFFGVNDVDCPPMYNNY